MAIEICLFDLIHHDPVGGAQHLQSVPRHLADDPDRKAGAGEGLPPDHLLGKPQGRACFPHLVFEEIAQWLDQFEPHHLWKPANIVVGLYRCRFPAHRGGALYDIGIECPLRQEIDLPNLVCLFFKDGDEFVPDPAPLFFGIDDSLKTLQESVRSIHIYHIHLEILAKGPEGAFDFLPSEEAVVDENAGQLFTDCPMDDGGNHSGIDTAGKGTDDSALAYLPLDISNLLFNEILGHPGRFEVTYLKEEVPQYFLALWGVNNLGMELYPDNFLLIGDGGYW